MRTYIHVPIHKGHPQHERMPFVYIVVLCCRYRQRRLYVVLFLQSQAEVHAVHLVCQTGNGRDGGTVGNLAGSGNDLGQEVHELVGLEGKLQAGQTYLAVHLEGGVLAQFA